MTDLIQTNVGNFSNGTAPHSISDFVYQASQPGYAPTHAQALSDQMHQKAGNLGFGLGRVLGKIIGTVKPEKDAHKLRGLQVRSRSSSHTSSDSRSSTSTDSSTVTLTNTATVTPTNTATVTTTSTTSPSNSKYTTDSQSATPTTSQTLSRTNSRTRTPTRTVTRTRTPTRSFTSSPSLTRSLTPSNNATSSRSITPSLTPIPEEAIYPGTDIVYQEIADTDPPIYAEQDIVDDLALFDIRDISNLDGGDAFDGQFPVPGLNSSYFFMHSATNGQLLNAAFAFRDGLFQYTTNNGTNLTDVSSGYLLDRSFGFTYNVSNSALEECDIPFYSQDQFRTSSSSSSPTPSPSTSGASSTTGTVFAAVATAVATGINWFLGRGSSDADSEIEKSDSSRNAKHDRGR